MNFAQRSLNLDAGCREAEFYRVRNLVGFNYLNAGIFRVFKTEEINTLIINAINGYSKDSETFFEPGDLYDVVPDPPFEFGNKQWAISFHRYSVFPGRKNTPELKNWPTCDYTLNLASQ